MTQWRVATRRILVEKDVKQRGIVSDVLTNWESVKYFTAEHRELTRYKESILSYQDTEAKWQISYQLLFLIQTFLLSFGLMAGSLIIAFRALRGEADAAQFIVFTQYFMQLSGPLDRLGWLYRQLSQNATDAEKMFALLAQKTEVNDHPDAKDLVVTDGIIEFDNVNFSYDGEVQALKGVSFKIGKGQSMALVGESGSGKSTILRLLYRFYDITSGRILIDGQDISKVTQLSLRRAIGIVPQDSVLWNDTIGANISYGKEGATDEEVITAATAARLHDRILSFPEEYATIVGERGVRLSGGEKQRVSLARMFLKSPAILVLDEATSALDTETEREIQKALAELAKGRSSLSIAHRLSTIINSDQIVVMKDGSVIENGTYKELLELDGAFASM
ncbi:ATP-binding cassette, sub-family B, member 6, isoform CRA_f [Naematelia encephala]|uniref:ATP-binding cassette, sub-family B, member 6, isoform CRA_f n=1 Tax=Naematelia encephala TaxID=71784 RepID=A0A1Y2AMG8_9TREE|nr:ATP-binding cassette, sub-family B, member 6, isoform CRA_f [Naematelia encephala]